MLCKAERKQAHHEKILVIDHELAFVGGIDICFGRWDLKQHPLADLHPSTIEKEIWPGQDYNNNVGSSSLVYS